MQANLTSCASCDDPAISINPALLPNFDRHVSTTSALHVAFATPLLPWKSCDSYRADAAEADGASPTGAPHVLRKSAMAREMLIV